MIRIFCDAEWAVINQRGTKCTVKNETGTIVVSRCQYDRVDLSVETTFRFVAKIGAGPVVDIEVPQRLHLQMAEAFIEAASTGRWVRVANVLYEAAGSNLVYVRTSVASTAVCPPEILEQLSTDPENWVRRCVANHPQTPPHVLQRLLNDVEVRVVAAAAGNPSTPPEALDAVIFHSDEAVRSSIASNPNVSLRVRALHAV